MELQTLSIEGLHQSCFSLHSKLDTIYLVLIIILLINLKVCLLLLFFPFSVASFCHTLCSYYQLISLLCTSFIVDFAVTGSNDLDCSNKCHCHPMNLIQFIDVKIAGYQHTNPGRAKIFGFVAARDRIKPLRNYVYRRDIDNCAAVSVQKKTVILSALCFLSLQLHAHVLLSS